MRNEDISTKEHVYTSCPLCAFIMSVKSRVMSRSIHTTCHIRKSLFWLWVCVCVPLTFKLLVHDSTNRRQCHYTMLLYVSYLLYVVVFWVCNTSINIFQSQIDRRKNHKTYSNVVFIVARIVSVFAVFRWTVVRIWNFFNLKPSTPQGQSSTKNSTLFWRS